jgi:hypothetical protein
VFDGDPQARAKDRDRDRAVYVIAAALRNGQISQQDHDLRVERVRSSTTVGDLEGLVRDIATAPAALPPTAVVAPVAPVVAPASTGTAGVGSVPADLYGPAPSAKKHTAAGTKSTPASAQAARKVFLGCLAVVLVFLVAPIAFGVILFASSSGGGGSEVVETDAIPAGQPFELTAAGLRDFVTAYDETFDSTEVVRAVFYDAGYVVSWVPAGDDQLALWNYLDGAFDQIGDPMEDTEDFAPVDLADLRPAKVMMLVRTAQQTLGVPDPASTYVIFDSGWLGEAPQLMVFVSDDDGKSGYIQADLDGTIVQTSKAS